MTVIAMDLGGSTIKCGLVGNSPPTFTIPNCTAKHKGQIQLLIGDQTETAVHDASQVTYTRPFDRGYLVNWNCEMQIWERLFGENFLDIATESSSLVVTTPLLNPTQLQNSMDQVVFEEFNFLSYCRISSAESAVRGYHLQNSTLSSSCTLVIDSGFSFTHVIPMLNSKPYLPAVKRLNVGGKLLTNYLKEIVSFRQWNMMDETSLMNEVKEALCYCSLDFMNELRNAGLKESQRTSILKEWVLPDYETTQKGYIKEDQGNHNNSNNEEISTNQTQVLKMNLERIAVPEVLFHPSDIGINQAGIAEAIVQAVQLCPPEYQGLLYQNIVAVGGNTKFPNFIERLNIDLRPLVPSIHSLQIYHPNNWEGVNAFASSLEWNNRKVTKQEYEEGGSDYCRMKFEC